MSTTANKPSIDFASVLATSVHDMKNSLCMLIQSLDTLAMQITEENPKYGPELANLHYEASRLNGDLLHLLALYRADQQQLPLHIEEFFIEDLVEELISRNQLYISSRKIDVELDIESDLAWYLDQDLIGSLLNDVLVNAMRYTKNRIEIKAQEENGYLVMQIVDNGGGYPDEMLTLNQPIQDNFNIQTGRTGLGLFFARLIAAAHKRGDLCGNIELKNKSDSDGSVFTLRLP
ncbi:sensor histidine kinase [Corallincola holothuriorum]|uniref:histidine kinase n=1 Tax=Corallincola holothuriorum TaxID=2282215 RepID=A0A368NLJ3_9GAMM|nr:HAMP domain-containing sensor histidine kinase [Corallincola holothuriorum]RCU50504.1 sensor histidine kinase [Corallincola holothuriorum]